MRAVVKTKQLKPIPWDVIIVGGGPAGSAAAMVLARCRRRVLVIDEGKTRNRKAPGIHNYISRDGVAPGEFTDTVHKELVSYNVTFVKSRAVTAEALAQHGFAVQDAEGKRHVGRRLLVATGVTDNIPDVPGMEELWGKHIFHCPFCDGWESCDKVIGLYSHSRNGYGMALALRQLTDLVILFTDGARYLTPHQKAQLAVRNIQVVTSGVTSVERKSEHAIRVNLDTSASILCGCIFTNEGNTVNNDLVKQLGGRCNANGSVPVTKMQTCNVQGLYVAGDVVCDVQFVALAAAEGLKAGAAIHNDLLRADNLFIPSPTARSGKVGGVL